MPYVPKEWNRLLADYCQPGKKINGTTVLGRYLAKMKLIQYNKYRWKDTEYLQEIDHKKIREALEVTGADEQTINNTIIQNTFSVEEHQTEMPEEYRNPAPVPLPIPAPAAIETYSNPIGVASPSPAAVPESDSFVSVPQPEPEEDLGLTEEDKTYLALK